MKTNTEEFRQFTVVCRIALQRGDVKQVCGDQKKMSVYNLGASAFGLTASQVQSAVGIARDEISEVVRLDRIRKNGRVNFPTRSDEVIAATTRKLALVA